MGYNHDIASMLTNRIVDELDASVRQMVSGSQKDAYSQAYEMIETSTNQVIRNISDEVEVEVISPNEMSFLDDFDDFDDSDYIDAVSFQEIPVDNNSDNAFPANINNGTTDVLRFEPVSHVESQQVNKALPVNINHGSTDVSKFEPQSNIGNSNPKSGGSMNFGFKRKEPKQVTQEDMEKFFNIGKKCASAYKKEADNIYFEGTTDNMRRKPTVEDIERTFSASSMDSAYKRAAKNTREGKENERNEKIYYKSCVLSDYNGNEKSYKVVKCDCSYLANIFEKDNPMYNIAILRKALTREVEKMVGSWGRVREIYVRSEQLIINGVQCIPTIPSSFRSSFPFDTAELIENGCFASLFDWSVLKSMSNMYMLDIDDEYLFRTAVADGVGLSRRIGVKSLFKFCKRIEHLIINGVDLCSEDSEVEMKKRLAKGKHFDNLFDGFEFDLYAGTGGIRSWTANNFRNYANSRGNKGLLRYICGMGALGTVAVAGFIPDAVAHLGGGLIKGIASFWKAGTTPVE